jgi:hypothetical protein
MARRNAELALQREGLWCGEACEGHMESLVIDRGIPRAAVNTYYPTPRVQFISHPPISSCTFNTCCNSSSFFPTVRSGLGRPALHIAESTEISQFGDIQQADGQIMPIQSADATTYIQIKNCLMSLVNRFWRNMLFIGMHECRLLVRRSLCVNGIWNIGPICDVEGVHTPCIFS